MGRGKYLILLALLSGCSSAPKSPPGKSGTVPVISAVPVVPANPATPDIPVLPPAGSGRGGYYQDDGPAENPPAGLMEVPNAEPKIEPYSPRANRPYTVFGKTYTPITDEQPFKQRGIGSWYGKKFHGQKTSSGERYDMFKMTAAHPTLPIPSYARVTNLANGAQVIVRINDRGPFHSSRIIDLSYTAALKLGYLGKGSSQLEVERVLPGEMEGMAVSAVNAANGFYLQLGAYTQLQSAEAVRKELSQKLSQVRAGTLPPIELVEYGVFYRLYSGPFATREEAATAAQLAQDAGIDKPVIVQR